MLMHSPAAVCLKHDSPGAVALPVQAAIAPARVTRETRAPRRARDLPRQAAGSHFIGLTTGSLCLAALTRKAQRQQRRVQPGRIAPEDPILRDRAQYGKGLYSQADFLRFLQTAKPYGWAELELEGEVPAGLDGILYHVGPGRSFRGSTIYKHFLDGDGFVNAFHVSSGTVRYKGDFVRTPEYQQEEAADAVLFRGAFGTAKPGGVLCNALDLRSKNLANTNVVSWGGHLLALYEAGHPSRLHEKSLAYLGDETFQGLLAPGVAASSGFPAVDGLLGLGGTAFTAHPKMDPAQHRLVGFSWSSKKGGIEIGIHEWDEEFNLAHEAASKLFLDSCDSSPHDFGLTEKRCVFFENRFKLGDLPGYLLGLKGPAESLVGEPELAQRIHIVSRDASETVTIEGSTGVFDVHVAHCHDGPPLGYGGKQAPQAPSDLITAYTGSWDEFPEGSLFGEWNSEDEQFPFELPERVPPADMSHMPRTRLVRHIIDLKSQEVVERSVVAGCENLSMEHPTINCSYTGSSKCRYIYMVVGNEVEKGLSSPPSGWAKVDLRTGETQRFFAGSRAFTDEPHFVPRRGGGSWSPGEPQGEGDEDDGWVLAMLFDAQRGQSCLCVFDAARIDQGPLCRAWLPHPVPHSLHGCFVPTGASFRECSEQAKKVPIQVGRAEQVNERHVCELWIGLDSRDDQDPKI